MNKRNVLLGIVISIICIVGIVITFFYVKSVINVINYNNRITQILSDDQEVERKWLIKSEEIPYHLSGMNVEVYDILQTYLCFNPEMRVRKYNNGESYEYTIKTNMTADGMVRDEANIDIDEEQYENLLSKKEGMTIHKTRYQFYEDNQLIAIDIFHDELEGLAYMEIEFPNREESEAYVEPNWVVKDVTADINYKNGHLARFGIPKEAYQE